MSASAEPSPLADDLDYVLSRTANLWEPLRGANLFLTGGTGFFGRWLLETFAHANAALGLNARMVVLSRQPEAFVRKAPHLAGHPGMLFASGDVRSFTAKDVRRQLGSAAPHAYDYVIHAATDTVAPAQAPDPWQQIDTIVAGTRAALNFAVDTGARRFLLTSSGAVYGRQPDGVTHLPENYLGGPDCMDPRSAYGEGKRLAEVLCACYHQQHGLVTLITRPFAFVGPFLSLDAHFAIGNFIRDALRGGPVKVAGDGTPFRSYLYAADLAVWLWTILFQGQPMRPYNVGSDEAVTILDLARAVSGVLGIKEPPEVALPRTSTAAPARYVPCIQRTATELGLKVGIPLSAAIEKTARWARAQNAPGEKALP